MRQKAVYCSGMATLRRIVTVIWNLKSLEFVHVQPYVLPVRIPLTGSSFCYKPRLRQAEN